MDINNILKMDISICEVIAEKEYEDILNHLKYSSNDQNIDMVELRGDKIEILNELNVANIIDEAKNILREKPLLFTYRTEDKWKTNDRSQKQWENYFDINLKALSADNRKALPDMIDLEISCPKSMLDILIGKAKEKNVAIIASKHIFEIKDIAEIEIIRCIEELWSTGADVAKLAVSVENEVMTERIICVGKKLLKEYQNKKFVLIGMGEAGRKTRRTDAFFGSRITYAKGIHSTALGQYSAEELSNMRIR